MPKHPERWEDDDTATEPAHVKAERELYERYRRKFGEYPPMFSIGPNPIDQIKRALETGQPIRENIPPGTDA